MRKNLLLPVIVVLVVGVIAVIAFFSSRLQSEYALRSTPSSETIVEKGDVQIRYLKNGADTGTPDAASLGRVVRGYMKSTNLEANSFVLSTQVNWPQKDPQRPIPFKTMPNTEYLCWGKNIQHEDGTTADYEDTIYLLDDSHKLYEKTQKNLTPQEAEKAMAEGVPVILALQEPYINTQINSVFQVAIIGCQ